MPNERKDVSERRNQIKTAIMRLEAQQPFQHWKPKQILEELKKQKIIIPRERIHSYLRKLEIAHHIVKNTRGRYISATALLYQKPLKEFLDLFVVEYILQLQMRIAKGVQVDFQEIINEAYQTMINCYVAHVEIEDLKHVWKKS